MAKRYTDNGKWQPWFRTLDPIYKCFWFYLLDMCDVCGVWGFDPADAYFKIGANFDLEEAFKAFNNEKERVKKIDGGKKWFITEFCQFQYGVLSSECKPHKPVITLLTRYGLFEFVSNQRVSEGFNTLVDKEKEKEQEKGIVKGKQKQGEEGLVLLSQEERQKLQEKMGAKKTQEYIQKLECYLGSKGRKYKSHYFTILSWWHKDGSPKDPVKQVIKSPEKPEVVLTDAERKKLIQTALPTYGGRKS